MGVDFSQQGLSRMTCRLCTARHMPCSNFDLKFTDRVLRRGEAAPELCATRRKIGAGAERAPRSGAYRAATKRADRPAGVGGAWSLRRCACPCFAYAARGDGQRVRFIGRERGYCGVGFGGISVGVVARKEAGASRRRPHASHVYGFGNQKAANGPA